MPPEEVLAPTITTFENRLGKFWSKQDVKYDFEVTLKCITASVSHTYLPPELWKNKIKI